MDPWFVVAVVLAAVAVPAVILARARGQDIAAVRQQAGGSALSAAAAGSRLRAESERAERGLAAERVAHETLLDLLDQGVLVVDGRSRIVGANRAAHGLLQRAPGTLVGRTLMEAFLDPAIEALAATADGDTATAELRLADVDGPTLLARARRRGDDGLWLVLEDVSELRRLQRIRSEFIDNLSHELRTPLTTMRLLAETLTREAELSGDAIPARMRERIVKIDVETEHLSQMASELLDLSRIEGGGTLRMAEGLDMARIAAGAAERLRLFAERQGVELQVVTAPVPPVRGDAERLGQVVVNLVHNAVKFSPDGGTVTVRTAVHGDRVLTTVEDQGIGIPKAAQDRIFERFYKVDRARQRGVAGGTGLGLAIARHVVEQHGGSIRVTSRDGSGSTFAVELPTADDPTPRLDRPET